MNAVGRGPLTSPTLPPRGCFYGGRGRKGSPATLAGSWLVEGGHL